MTNTFCDISNDIDNAIVEVISDVDKVTKALNMSYFVIGATARDIIDLIYRIQSSRLTRDIDFAINVADWNEYHSLTRRLISECNFKTDTKIECRFYSYKNRQVDIIPFGKIENPRFSVITPDSGFTMSTLGFEEISKACLIVTIRDGPLLTVAIPTPASLTIMKFISWDENPERAKDAKDIIHIIDNYNKYGNFERLHSEHIDIINDPDYDFVCGFARLLGRDIALIIKPATMEMLVKILERETCDDSEFRLIKDMITGSDYDGDKFRKTFEIIKSLKLGLTESPH